MVNNLPATSQDGQYGTNNCGTGTSQTSKCQTAWIKYGLSLFATVGVFTDVVNEIHSSASDFCVWAPRKLQSTFVCWYDTLIFSTLLYLAYLGTVGDTERVNIAYCTKSGRGARTIPNGALKGVHFVKTPEYVQVTGVGDFTKINIPKGDSGGELDNRGADGMFFLLLSFFNMMFQAVIDGHFVFHRQGQPK